MPATAAFKLRYPITPRLLTGPSRRRPMVRMDPGVRFIVAHDTGNPRSTAANNVAYYERSRDLESASAHLFVDDQQIIECIPALTGAPEKAWHVRYVVDNDNRLFGCNADDAAIGIEYCYGGRIDADEAYRKYVWTLAYACFRYGLDATKVTGHCFLDPGRKTDPVTGLADSRRSYDQLLRDIAQEIAACSADDAPDPRPALTGDASSGTARVVARLNLRRGYPSRMAPAVRMLQPGDRIDYVRMVENGEPVNGNARWYCDANGDYFWSGAVTT